MIPAYMYWPVAVMVTFVVIFLPTMVAVFRAENRKTEAEDQFYRDRLDVELRRLKERCPLCGDLLYGRTRFPSHFSPAEHASAWCSR